MKLTDKEVVVVLRRYKDGDDIGIIAADFGVSRAHVSRLANDVGMFRRKFPGPTLGRLYPVRRGFGKVTRPD